MYETITGKWTKQLTGELRGDVGAGFAALCLDGEYTDTNYEVGADVTVTKGTKASLIAFYAISESQVINYLEMVLDVTNTKVTLNKVEDGTPTEITSMSYPLELGETYECRLICDSSAEIRCVVNGSTLIKKTVAGYVAGKHGFGCAGTVATDFSTFFKYYFKKPDDYGHILDVIGDIKAVNYLDIVGKNGTLQDYYDVLALMIEECSRFIDGECEKEDGFFKTGGITTEEYLDGKGIDTSADLQEQLTSSRNRARTFFLTQRPIISISSIHENEADIGDADDWQPITTYRENKGKIVFAIGSIPSKGFKNIRVIYIAGYAKTPSSISQACRRLIVNFVNKGISDKTSAFVSFNRPQAVNFATPDVYTPYIRTILSRYKSPSYGEM